MSRDQPCPAREQPLKAQSLWNWGGNTWCSDLDWSLSHGGDFLMRVCFELCGSCLLPVSVLSWGANPRMANLGQADPLLLKVPLLDLFILLSLSRTCCFYLEGSKSWDRPLPDTVSLQMLPYGKLSGLVNF